MLRNLTTIIMAAIVGGAVAYFLSASSATQPADTEQQNTVYQSVTKERVIRCAYASYPPFISIDPNSKQLSGIFYDLINEMGKRLGFEVKWVEEVGYANINQGFTSGRYDLFCAGLWPNSIRASTTVFSEPLFYDPVFAWARADDNRFNGDPALLNNPEVTLGVIDGDATMAIAKAQFPLAKTEAVTQNQSIADVMNLVISKKADAKFEDLLSGENYLRNNPGTIKNIAPDKPVRVFGFTIGIPEQELALKHLLDTVIDEMQDDGTVQRVIENYLGKDQKALYLADETYED